MEGRGGGESFGVDGLGIGGVWGAVEVYWAGGGGGEDAEERVCGGPPARGGSAGGRGGQAHFGGVRWGGSSFSSYVVEPYSKCCVSSRVRFDNVHQVAFAQKAKLSRRSSRDAKRNREEG